MLAGTVTGQCADPIASWSLSRTVGYIMDAGIGNELNRFLLGIGIGTTDEREMVVSTVKAELASRGLEADVTSVRWGRAVLESDPVTVLKLGFHRDAIEKAVHTASNGAVNELRIRCRGKRGQHA